MSPYFSTARTNVTAKFRIRTVGKSGINLKPLPFSTGPGGCPPPSLAARQWEAGFRERFWQCRNLTIRQEWRVV